MCNIRADPEEDFSGPEPVFYRGIPKNIIARQIHSNVIRTYGKRGAPKITKP